MNELPKIKNPRSMTMENLTPEAKQYVVKLKNDFKNDL